MTPGALLSVSLSRTSVPTEFFGRSKSVRRFTKVGRVGEGTYGVVYAAKNTETNEKVALKRIRFAGEQDGFPLAALREIQLLKAIDHDNIVRVLEVVVGTALTDVFMVMELCEIDLAALMDNVITQLNPPRFTEREVKCLMTQLLAGLECLHDRHIIHRDLKMSNLLLTSHGILKIADFGLARHFSSPPIPMTPRVVTLWYRSPELLLGAKTYTTAVDMWSTGCILAELLITKPLLPGKTDPDQLTRITNLLGYPTPQIWPSMTHLPLYHLFKIDPVRMNLYSQVKAVLGVGASNGAVELVQALLVYDPERRVDVREARRFAYFRREGPNPCLPSEIRMRVGSNGGTGHSRSQREYLGGGQGDHGGSLRLRLEGEVEGAARKRVNLGRTRDVELELGAMPFQQFDLEQND
ncbi:Cdc2- kinase [Rhizoclosmatium sp. JEL0117]|nr:Cdc2- kinase [Rhizoclosmatium sp. JEL0117]